MSKDTPNLVLASARLDLNVRKEPENTASASDRRKGVQSVDLAFSILRAMEAADRPLALKELAERLSMSAPKVHHYLVSLVRAKVLRQAPDGTYDLGPFALQLGLSALRRLDPIEQGIQTARALRDEIGEAVFVAIWGSHGPTIIRYFEGFHPVTVEVRAGLVLPVATSATGHVFLAWGNQAAVVEVTAQDSGQTANSVDAIRRKTRKAGVGMVDGALLPRIASVSAPVFDRDGRLELALTCLGWRDEFDMSPDGKIVAALKRRSNELSAELGYTAGSSAT